MSGNERYEKMITAINSLGGLKNTKDSVLDTVEASKEKSFKKGFSETSQDYIAQSVLNAKSGNKLDLGALNTKELEEVKKQLEDINKTEPFKGYTERIKEVNAALKGVQDTTRRTLEDQKAYHDELAKLAEQYDTTTETMEAYAYGYRATQRDGEKLTKELAQEAAAVYRQNKAYNEGRKVFSSVSEGYKDYIKQLKKGKTPSIESAEAFGQITKSLKDIGLNLNPENMVKYSDKIEKLFSGTEEEAKKAYAELSKTSIIDTLTNQFEQLGISAENCGIDINKIASEIANLDPGTPIDKEYSKQLVNMVNNSRMTLDQMQELFRNCQLEMPPVESYKLTEDSVKTTGTTTRHQYNGDIPVPDANAEKGYRTEHIEYEWKETTDPVEQKFVKFKDQDVIFKKGNYGGGGGGLSVSPSTKPSGGSGSGGKKGGSGGGSKSVEKKQDSELDRYEKVNAQLALIEKNLAKIKSQQDKLIGTKLVDNLNKQLNLLNRQISTTKEKLKIANKEANEYKNKLSKNYGITFDAEGIIKNYESVYNKELARYNAAIDKFNKSAQTDADKKRLEDAKKRYDDFKDLIGKYDTLIDGTIPELEQDIQDAIDQQIEINVKKFNLEFEVSLDLKDAKQQ